MQGLPVSNPLRARAPRTGRDRGTWSRLRRWPATCTVTRLASLLPGGSVPTQARYGNEIGQVTARRRASVTGLRANSFAALVMLLIEFGLGSWVNLYAHLPAADHGRGTFAAFADAIAKGPA